MLIFVELLMVIIANIIESTIAQAMINTTDLNNCKLTQFGIEYKGQKGTTAGDIRCQSWYGHGQIHSVHPGIENNDFPEKSMQLAKNYCRNPTRDPRGPWCYTLDPSLIDDECGIPLCNFGECRITGVGAEYAGKCNKSASNNKCETWDKKRVQQTGLTEKYQNSKFPDLSREKAKNYCRNPDNDIGGPWCWVEEENYEYVKKQYCDVSFCDDKNCLVYTRNSSVYSTIKNIHKSIGSLKIWIKLWNPDDELDGEARLLLSLLPIPTSSKHIAQDWRAGTEIIISNSGTGQIYPNDDDDEVQLEPTPNIILGSKWTPLTVNWADGFISVTQEGSSKPIFIDEYAKENTISSTFKDSFLSYGLMGTGVLWSTEFCNEVCEVYTTFGLEYINVLPIKKNNISFDINFYVRANQEIYIKFYQTPGSIYPSVELAIDHENSITLTHQSSEKANKLYLKNIQSLNILNYWKWNEFTVSLFGSHFRLFSKRYYGNDEILYAKEHLFSSLRWFSFGSNDVIAHWTFFCAPEDADNVEIPTPPNCISNTLDFSYNGSQWTTVKDLPCIPWIANEIPDNEKNNNYLFIDQSTLLQATNKCKNPTQDTNGPYCYVFNNNNNKNLNIIKNYCSIRTCRSLECRMAGTANDYIGTLSTTRSGRKCASWVINIDNNNNNNDNNDNILKNTRYDVSRPSGLQTTFNSNINEKEKEQKKDKEAEEEKDDDDEEEEEEEENKLSGINEDTMAPKAIHDIVDSFDDKNIKYSDDKILRDTSSMEFMNYTIDNNKLNSPDVTKSSAPIVFRHQVDPAYLNDTLYPEQNAKNASNYCRDPSRSIAGTWCYTTDPNVPQDLCDVKDCEKPEECTFLVRGSGIGRRLYILPEHRLDGLHFALKAWEPDHPDSITFVFLADDGFKSRYILKIGAANNEKVLLYYQSETTDITLVMKKTLPHLLYIGKWSSFVIKIPRGKVQVFYEGSTSPLFDWEHSRPDDAFLPVYYYYTSEGDRTIGVSFDCNSGCPVEIVDTDKFNRIIPVSTWNTKMLSTSNRLELMIRARGVVLIPLILFPATSEYFALTLGEMNQWIFFLKNTHPNVKIFHKEKIDTPNLFTQNTWTNFTILWFNNTINVVWNGTLVFNYEHTSPLLFYFFSLSVDKGGWATWTANCLPPDIDGEPVDGGWSEWGPWACSASCNGGVGTSTRICNNPIPNVKGKPCTGPSILTGTCNSILCDKIMNKYTSLIVKEDQAINIPVDRDVIDAVVRDSLDSPKIYWTHNGIYMFFTDDRVKIKNYNIIINRAEVNDSGVYAITLHRIDDTHMIMKLVSLSVLPVRTSVTLRETLSMDLTCHCVVLGYQYSNLKIYWTKDKNIWKSYDTTNMSWAANTYHIDNVNSSHQGLWECHVLQNQHKFNWTTNAIDINVIGPPNWRTYLMEDDMTKAIFGWMPNETTVAMSVFIIFFIITVVTIITTNWYIRFQESLKGAMSQNINYQQKKHESIPKKSPIKSTPRRVYEKFQNLSNKNLSMKQEEEEEEAESLLGHQ
ncbi:hypothetical protein HCN44_011113 [Aphidius gifuensis]|uniref:Uncharacterized protein n=1 Tax=Aphidius gifuensis TaxID=684658 RepID=A0A835CSE2_APHGI|nr:hypothetical protein HCN44_011113 [Aphidius gifuensis]